MKLTFVNHACVCIQSSNNGHTLITDPWLMSPAFGGWTPSPRPSFADFTSLLESFPSYSLVISHGHDDHCDDFLIKHHMTPSSVFIPKFESPGFLYRIRRLVGDTTPVVELEDGKPLEFGQFRMMATINPNFTQNDAIIAMRDGEFSVVHANDNWHIQPDSMIKQLKEFLDGTEITYLAQIGIAGAYPFFYRGQTWSQKSQEATRQLWKQLESIEGNSRELNASRAFSYANESCFSYFGAAKYLAADLRDDVIAKAGTRTSRYQGNLGSIEDSRIGSLDFVNVRLTVPFCTGDLGEIPQQAHLSEGSRDTHFLNDLLNLEVQVNEYLSHNLGDARVSFQVTSYRELLGLLTYTDGYETSEVPLLTLYATHETWTNILEGLWTLEAITIGGCGVLQKSSQAWYAGEIHDALSRFGYRYQSQLRRASLGQA